MMIIWKLTGRISIEMNEIQEKIISEVRKIAKGKIPSAITDEYMKKLWITGFCSGYLERVIEVLKQDVKIKN